MCCKEEHEFPSKLISAKVNKTMHNIVEFSNRRFKEYGLTHQQAMVLVAIDRAETENKRINQKDIEKFLQIRNPSVTSLLNTMVKKGLIRRVQDYKDARSNIIEMTDEGKEKKRHIMEVFNATDITLTKDMTVDEIMMLQNLMERMIDNIEGVEKEEKN